MNKLEKLVKTAIEETTDKKIKAIQIEAFDGLKYTSLKIELKISEEITLNYYESDINENLLKAAEDPDSLTPAELDNAAGQIFEILEAENAYEAITELKFTTIKEFKEHIYKYIKEEVLIDDLINLVNAAAEKDQYAEDCIFPLNEEQINEQLKDHTPAEVARLKIDFNKAYFKTTNHGIECFTEEEIKKEIDITEITEILFRDEEESLLETYQENPIDPAYQNLFYNFIQTV